MKVVQHDFFEADFAPATVLTLYLLTSLNVKPRPKILAMRSGARVVSHAFNMGDWRPDAEARVRDHVTYPCIVPARVQGQWQLTLPDGEATLTVQQRYHTSMAPRGSAAARRASTGGSKPSASSASRLPTLAG